MSESTGIPPLHLERLDSLNSLVRIKALKFIQLVKDRGGLDLLIVSAYRSNDEQAVFYAQGRDANGIVINQSKVVTNAKPGASPHNFRLAFDVVPLQNGQPWWSAPDSIWRSFYTVAEEVGLDALGEPWGAYLSWDKGHFEEPGSQILMQSTLGLDL